MEMMERWLGMPEAQAMARAMGGAIRALNARDLAALRAALPPDYQFRDFRRTGVGSLGGAEAYVAFFAAMLEETGVVTTDVLYHVGVMQRVVQGMAWLVSRFLGTPEPAMMSGAL